MMPIQTTSIFVYALITALFAVGASSACASVASDADKGRNGYPFFRGEPYKIEKKTYFESPYGGWGLEPKRTYSLAYNGGPACIVIRDALNNAINNGRKAQSRVIFSTPRYPEQESKDDVKLEKDIDGKTFRYISQNPLYSDPIFLKWNYLGGYPDIDFPEMHGMKGYDETPSAHRHDIHDTFPKRWMIVPFKNDGHPYLVTSWTWGNGLTVQVEPPKHVYIWNVPPEELPSQDWNLAKTYAHYKPVFEQWPGADDTYIFKTTDAISKYFRLYPPVKNTPYRAKNLFAFPKIKAPENILPFEDLWVEAGIRHAEIVQFAKVSGRYYVVAPVSDDRIIVFDAAKEPGDDECYLNSQISRKKTQFTAE